MSTFNCLVPSYARRHLRAALSLIEVLVVIAIVTVVIGLIIPAVLRVRESANRAQCMNNLKQIGLACHSYHDTNGALPYTRTKGAETWALLLLPFLEEANIHNRWQFGQRYYAPANAEARSSVMKVYLCPTRRSPSQQPQLSLGGDVDRQTGHHVPGALSDYAACAGDPESVNDYWWGRRFANGAFWHGTYRGTRREVKFKDVFDGLSTTLLVGEKHIPMGRFGYPPDSSVLNGDTGASFKKIGPGVPLADGPRGTGQFGSYHPGMCPFVFADGSVHALAVNMDGTSLGHLANRHDGKSVQTPGR